MKTSVNPWSWFSVNLLSSNRTHKSPLKWQPYDDGSTFDSDENDGNDYDSNDNC